MVQLKKKLSGELIKAKPIVCSAIGTAEMPEPDVHVITTGGGCIPAHSKILASVSPVLENIIERPRKKGDQRQRKIPILGVPYDAVFAFVQFMYSSRCTDEQIERYSFHLLALSHVYLVPHLKQRCARSLSQKLTVDNVVDVLQLARLCDAPELFLKCMKLLSDNFRSVEQCEGWKFLQDHDPHLELEILQFIDEVESRKKRTTRRREAQGLYFQLSEAMECLEHICSEGCTIVGPYDMDPNEHKGPCNKFSTCNAIQLSIKHFGTCDKKVKGGCLRCKRTWQLFKLHSSICDDDDRCRVPLCRQIKLKAQKDRRVYDFRWRLLVRKVVLAKATRLLSARCQDVYARRARKRMD